jgi:hypothetical protein
MAPLIFSGGNVMRFRRSPRPTPYEDTSRRRAAFLHKQRLEREALPLFSDMIKAHQHSVDEEMSRRAAWWHKAEREQRKERADRWRAARVRLFAFDADQRRIIRDLWRTCPYPADPTYLADLLSLIRIGKVDPLNAPWIFHQERMLQTAQPPDPDPQAQAMSRHPRAGHNGGPPLDEPVAAIAGHCKHCRHWAAPPGSEQRAYELFQLGISRRRVKRPNGSCDRVLLGKRPSFSATTAEFGCGNFEALPKKPVPKGGGFVTIWKDGAVAWQGPEERMPARFLQEDLEF